MYHKKKSKIEEIISCIVFHFKHSTALCLQTVVSYQNCSVGEFEAEL